MKKITLIVVAVLVMAGLLLWVNGNSTREIKTEIEISVPVAQVWNMLAKIDDWERWSPIINQSSGDAILGSTLHITMMGEEEGKDGPTYNPVITILAEPRLLRWRATMMAGVIMTNDKVLELQATSTGTRLVHKELFSGMMVPLMWSSVEKNVPEMLNSMNLALKTEVENAAN